MNKKPFLNAIAAAFYIVIIVFIIQAITGIPTLQKELFIPMIMLGLLVISVSVMAYLFGYEPLKLYTEGRKEEAVKFFAKTLLTFAVIVIVFFFIIISHFGVGNLGVVPANF